MNELNCFLEIARQSVRKDFSELNREDINDNARFPLDNLILSFPISNEKDRRSSLSFEEQFEDEKECNSDSRKSGSKESPEAKPQVPINTDEFFMKVLSPLPVS